MHHKILRSTILTSFQVVEALRNKLTDLSLRHELQGKGVLDKSILHKMPSEMTHNHQILVYMIPMEKIAKCRWYTRST
jgi:hypothetical protein